ncbi:hypothetical protein [Pseudomonas sp. zfem005]|uniref:hypothetical protein n=1 Tax=Pseudomonas sp. zfem005 TaxID=3078200 RepID=UPI0029291FD2|nr:hypothetical protein [Pseudomonas sp. zfem005]MDU9414999.1 hypothetical protein [Pseudomonas sp. zfem005]
MTTDVLSFLVIWLLFVVPCLFSIYLLAPATRAWLHPVQGRRTGLSEHASPFGQTERRAQRTLDHAPP